MLVFHEDADPDPGSKLEKNGYGSRSRSFLKKRMINHNFDADPDPGSKLEKNGSGSRSRSFL